MEPHEQEERLPGEAEQFRLLKNPLPEPPRRSHVRMEFDLRDDGDDAFEDDFDLEIDDEDDFDI